MKRQAVIAGVAAVVVAGLFFLIVVKPVGAKISETKKKTEQARQTNVTLRLQLRELEAAKRNAPEVLARLAKYDLLLPQTTDLPVFIRQIQQAADSSGVDLTSIAPSPPSALVQATTDPVLAGKGVASINVVLQVNGGFFRLESFVQRLESLQRVVLVQNISIAPSVDAATQLFTLASTITLQMYVVNPALIPATPGTTPSASPTPGASASPSPTASAR